MNLVQMEPPPLEKEDYGGFENLSLTLKSLCPIGHLPFPKGEKCNSYIRKIRNS
ncbi:MAG: hypothetical protein US63_C0032G0005 [Candidatus Moranbacteria bacterium GW2011_GWC2_37_8]|nr:MAG: hypothetical protein US63_C0032G0005 [Candidatus Moranbacteria bacterium GW2011_GWC2_37_8]KKQ60693.1 MAG: hypothetical protein US82_C0030G0006 [Parcubacteria group bacterium GW2011_GWC1_38_22]